MIAALLGVGALAAVSLEWLALGWLSGVRFPQSGRAAARASWGLRLLIGAVLVAIAELLLALMGVGFSSVPLVLGLAAIGSVAVRATTRTLQAVDRSPKEAPVEPREAVGWLLLGLVLAAALVRSFAVPEAGWDAYSHWGLRAQAFASAGTLVNAHSEHEYYPPLVPLLETWLYAHLGHVSIDLAKTVWAVLGGAFSVCLGWYARSSLRAAWLGPYLALGILVGTTELLEGFWTGQADLALTAYVCLTTLSVWQWQQCGGRAWLLQAALFGAAAALTKFEGLPRVGVLAVAVLIDGVISRRCRFWPALLVPLSAAVVASGLWTVFELGHGISPNGEHLGAFQPLAFGGVLLALLAVFGGVRTGGGVVVALLSWAVSWRVLFEPRVRLLTLVVLLQSAATLLAFLVSATSPAVEVATSATRLVEQVLPLALFAGAIGLAGQATYNRRGR